VTADGYFGIDPLFCLETDIICAIVEMKTVAMLRKVDDHFEFVRLWMERHSEASRAAR
jgi:hypothetical protein